jgi:hypothetical protein
MADHETSATNEQALEAAKALARAERERGEGGSRPRAAFSNRFQILLN